MIGVVQDHRDFWLASHVFSQYEIPVFLGM